MRLCWWFCALVVLSGGRRGLAAPPGDRAPAAGGVVEVWHAGQLTGFAKLAADGSVAYRGGSSAVDDELRPVLQPSGPVLVLGPVPEPQAVAELRLLFGARLQSFADAAELAQALSTQPTAVVVCLSNPGTALAAAGRDAAVVASLDAYAELRGLSVTTHRVRTKPSLRLAAVPNWFPGVHAGQEIPWYGRDGELFIQRSLPKDGLPPNATVLAASTVDGSPMLIEEALPGGGRLVALDLESPNGKPGYDPGSKNKWQFVSRLSDRRPWYGVWVPKKLTFEEYRQALQALAMRHVGRLDIRDAGKGAAGDPIVAARLGRPEGPRFVFTGVLHGGEVMNAYGLLRLIEVLLDNPQQDARITQLLERYGIEVLPLVNVWGYAHGQQVNSRDCDLNRNFDYLWSEFKGDGGWRAKYAPEVLRGATPFSEGETQAVRDCLAIGDVAGYLDFHQHGMDDGHMQYMAHRPVQREREALLFLRELLDARLQGRYLIGDKPLQLKLNGDGSARPFSYNWAAAQGIVSCCFELIGGFEDSLTITDVVVQEALNFMWVVAACRSGTSTAAPAGRGAAP